MIMHWKRKVGVGKVTLMARVSCSVSSLVGMSKWNPGPSFTDRVPVTGGPLACPQWRFCGLGSRLGSNEKGLDVPVASEWGRARPLGLIYIFSPLALFDARQP